MKLLRFDELTATPWKNGGGVTRELASYPPGAALDDFLWRVSIADVAASGPFSAFPEVERVIMLLDGDGMRLEFDDGRTHDLIVPFAPYRFRGEDRVHAHLAGTPSKDFNLMLRRGRVDGYVGVWGDGGELASTAGTLVLFCAQGRWEATLPDGVRHELGWQQALVGECASGGTALRPLQPDSILVGVNVVPCRSLEEKAQS